MHSYFLRFYKRRNKFRFQIRKKLTGKDESKRELSACVVQKFNGYELLRNHLNSNERQNFVPVEIVYKPTLDDTKEINCYFAHISLVFHCKADKFRRGKKTLKCKDLDNAIIATITLSKVMKSYCKNIFLAAVDKLVLHILLIMEK